jgi:prepilin-type processing-associated H-X9-DG protein
MFGFHTARHDAGNVASMSNMKQILLASRMYALDHDERYPDSLGALYPDYVTTYHVFQHPGYKHQEIAEDDEIDDFASYVLIKGIDETWPADTILLYEKDFFVEEGWRNVGFVDGHVEEMSEEAFQRKLKEQQKEED